MEVRTAVRASFQLAGLLVVGVLVGAWVFIAPWVVGFPAGRSGTWTSSMWTNVWVGAIVIGSSAVGLLAALGLALAAALRSSRTRQRAEAQLKTGTDRNA
jgi:hypothetical protein